MVLVLPRSLARVNTVVMLHSAVPLALADIARSAGLAYTPAESALATLTRRGLVTCVSRAGRERYGPNLDSPYYPMAYLTALVDLPLAGAFGDEQVSVAYAYGPIARPGGAAKGIDLDLLVVGQIRDPAGMLTRLVLMGARLGRAVVPFMLTDADLERARHRGDGHVAAALAGVRLMGQDPGSRRVAGRFADPLLRPEDALQRPEDALERPEGTESPEDPWAAFSR